MASWPILFAFDLWVLYDRGSLLNVDYLWSSGLRPGVDTFYSYGLLPLALQHLVFAFGRGYLPMIACTVIAMVAMALIWAVLLRPLPRSTTWLVAIVCVTPMLLWVNPNFPYTLALLSTLTALALVMEDRLDLALAACAVGCWSVPSLPLALAGMVTILIVTRWAAGSERSVGALAKALAPGAVSYLVIGVVMVLTFGWQSAAATALPFQGAKFYAAKGYGMSNIVEFLSPGGLGLTKYLFTRSGWWILSSALLLALAAYSGIRMLRARSFDSVGCVVMLFAALHVLFVFVAPGSTQQHVIYDPLLAGGVLIGLGSLAGTHLRKVLLAVFVILAVTGSGEQVRDTWRAWRDQTASPDMAGLYSTRQMQDEWKAIVALSAAHPLLMLTYGTGIHHYFPTIQSPQIWFLEVGQQLPSDKDRILAQMRATDIVVTAHNDIVESIDPRLHAELLTMQPIKQGPLFDIWQHRTR
ncbi:hypothetical protein DYH55_15905 [Methylovirgula sp. 4M-Z18]|nr:hypothetical protein DYH55_15905 [Methylovirgula sp. 4M-Z18]